MKAWLGVFAALTLIGAAACSSSSSSGGTPAGGSKTDAGTDTGGTGGSGETGGTVGSDSGGGTGTSETGPKPVETGPTEDGTTGKVCKGTEECDVTGNGVNLCTSDSSGGSLYPTAVCLGTDCDPGDGTTIAACDADTGVCLSTGDGGICLGYCQFNAADGAAPTGCNGDKNACNVLGWGTDDKGALFGVGFCWGGCTAATDCPTGSKCQVEEGLCLKTTDTFTKKVGDACTAEDDAKYDSSGKKTKPAACNCIRAKDATTGFCSSFCKMGETDCGAAFKCDAMLPLKDDKGADLFKAAPKGIAGLCFPTCTTDADCTKGGIVAYCDQNAGVGAKTCQPGTKK